MHFAPRVQLPFLPQGQSRPELGDPFKFPGMLLAVEENKPFNPLAISLFGPQRIMLKPHDLTDLIQQFEFRIGPEASARN